MNENYTSQLKKVNELNDLCVDLILEDKNDEALSKLKKAESSLEKIVLDSGKNVKNETVILILHNIACCFQKLKKFDNCVTYLEAVIFHYDNLLKSKYSITNDLKYFQTINNVDYLQDKRLGDMILQMRFSAKFHLQMCAVLSQANNHQQALEHARISALICEDNISKTNILFQQIKTDLFGENVLEVKKILDHIYDKIKTSHGKGNPLLYQDFRDNKLYSTTTDKDIKGNKIKNEEVKSALKKISNLNKSDDWVYFLNIGNIMYLSALNSEDLDLESDPKFEILRDSVFEKIVMLTVAYFCISTEIRFLESSTKIIFDKSEFWHSKSVDYACFYLPSQCPLVKHYVSSYHKHFTSLLCPIPEDEIINTQIDFQRIVTDSQDPIVILKSKTVPFIKSLNLNKLTVKPGFFIKQKILNANEAEKSESNSFREKELLKSSSHCSLFKKPFQTTKTQTEILLKISNLGLDKNWKKTTRPDSNKKFSDLIKMYKTNNQNNASAPVTSRTPIPSGQKNKSQPLKSQLELNEVGLKSCQTSRNLSSKNIKISAGLKKEEKTVNTPNNTQSTKLSAQEFIKTTPALPKIKKMKDLLEMEDSSLTLSLLKNRLKDYNLGDKKILGSHKNLQHNKLKINQYEMLISDKTNMMNKPSINSSFNLSGKLINFGNLQVKKVDSSYSKK